MMLPDLFRRNKDWDHRIMILKGDEYSDHLFQPLFYQVETSALVAKEITYSVRSVFPEAKILTFWMNRAFEPSEMTSLKKVYLFRIGVKICLIAILIWQSLGWKLPNQLC
jgi:hypothetical protein